MRHRTGRVSLIVLGMLGLAAAAVAHDFWLEPSAHAIRVGESLGLSIRIGHGTDLTRYARKPAHVRRFEVIGADGSTPVPGEPGDEPAGTITIEQAGDYVVVYHSNRTFIELEAAEFEDYLEHEGLGEVVGKRRELGESAEVGREVYSRCAKSVVRVIDGNGQPVTSAASHVMEPVGLPLEIVPVGDPFALRAGRGFTIELLHEGKPLAGALVEMMHWVDEQSEPITVSARTGVDGRAELRPDRAGRWIAAVTHMVRLSPSPYEGDQAKADWESLWASLSVEVGE